MSKSNTTASPDPATASWIFHKPVSGTQPETEHDSYPVPITGRQLANAIGGSLPETPPESYSSLLRQLHVSRPAQAGLLQYLQRSHGNGYVGKVIQAKLSVGAPNDTYEQEADHIAERVMRMPQAKCAGSCDGECPRCQMKQAHRQVQPKRGRTVGSEQSAEIPLVDEVLRSPGEPLESDTRTFMESRFGYDFSHVRVHTDARAAESARAMNALAYTVGTNLVFDAGQFTPTTETGKRLLAHELTHHIQQTSPPSITEHQAESVGSSWIAGEGAGVNSVSKTSFHAQRTCRAHSDEPYYQSALNYCKDTGFSGSLHPGQRCYREVPVRSSYFDCPSGDQVCFDELGSCHDSYDLVSTVESKNSDSSCNLHGYCFIGHAAADIAPGIVGIDSAQVVQQASCYAMCARVPGVGKFMCLQSCGGALP